MRQARKLTVALLATLILAAGVILSVPLVPGPGILLLLLGLTLLATEFDWAQEWLEKLKRQAERWRRKHL